MNQEQLEAGSETNSAVDEEAQTPGDCGQAAAQSAKEAMEAQMTEEQKAEAKQLVEIAAVANRLIMHDSEYSSLVASMLAARQLYAMCLYELERLVDSTDFKKALKVDGEPALTGIGKSFSELQIVMLKEVIVNAAAIQSQQQFDENHLFKGMVETVFPWMQRVVGMHTELQKEQRLKEFMEHEAKRKLLPVCFNVQINPQTADEDGFWVGRHKPLLFVGERKVVRWLVDHMMINSIQQGNNVEQVIRLNSGGKPKHTGDPSLIDVAKNEWAGVATTNTAFPTLFERLILGQSIAPPDILIIDDLLHAYQSAATFTSITSRANESQKKLKRWAEGAGCLLVGCLTLPRPLQSNELNTPEYETLRMHNILRGVVAEKITVDQAEWCKVMVGQHEVARFPIEELDAYGESKIIQA